MKHCPVILKSKCKTMTKLKRKCKNYRKRKRAMSSTTSTTTTTTTTTTTVLNCCCKKQAGVCVAKRDPRCCIQVIDNLEQKLSWQEKGCPRKLSDNQWFGFSHILGGHVPFLWRGLNAGDIDLWSWLNRQRHGYHIRMMPEREASERGNNWDNYDFKEIMSRGYWGKYLFKFVNKIWEGTHILRYNWFTSLHLYFVYLTVSSICHSCLFGLVSFIFENYLCLNQYISSCFS